MLPQPQCNEAALAPLHQAFLHPDPQDEGFPQCGQRRTHQHLHPVQRGAPAGGQARERRAGALAEGRGRSEWPGLQLGRGTYY